MEIEAIELDERLLMDEMGDWTRYSPAYIDIPTQLIFSINELVVPDVYLGMPIWGQLTG
jgi:hypothetical protein